MMTKSLVKNLIIGINTVAETDSGALSENDTIFGK